MKILRLEITDKCNLKCEMCWSCEWKHNDMQLDELKRIITDYKKKEENGTVVLTSREPLLSLNFTEVLDLCTNLNLDIKILTNCTLMNEMICKKIMESNVSLVGVSLHGDQELHDSIVRVNGAYLKTINGIRLLDEYRRKHNKDLEIRITTIMRKELYDNINLIMKISKKYNANLRIQHMMWYHDEEKNMNIKMINDRYGYTDYIIEGFPSNTNISCESVSEIIEKSKKLALKYGVDLQVYPELNKNKLREHYSENSSIKHEGYCDHPSESIRVRANGDVSFCQYIDRKIGNLRIDSLDDIIYNNEQYKLMCAEFLDGKLLPVCEKCCHYINEKKFVKNNNYKI